MLLSHLKSNIKLAIKTENLSRRCICKSNFFETWKFVLKKPWGKKKAKTQPKRTPITMAMATRDRQTDCTFSLRPAISSQRSSQFHKRRLPFFGIDRCSQWLERQEMILRLWLFVYKFINLSIYRYQTKLSYTFKRLILTIPLLYFLLIVFNIKRYINLDINRIQLAVSVMMLNVNDVWYYSKWNISLNIHLFNYLNYYADDVIITVEL